jgi:Helicase conserved C-terminal domain
VDGGQPVPRAASLTDWLRGRDDRQLARLFRLRPDLALPAPADLAALAGRVAVRTSTQRAVDNLDAYTLRALENLVLAADDTDAVDAPPGDALDTLLDLALVWGDADLVHLTPNVRESVGPYPAGLGRPAASLLLHVPDIQLVPVLRNLGLPPSPQPRAGGAVAAVLADRERLTALVDASDPGELEVLDRLAAGPPVGTVRNTRLVGADAELSAAHRLINRGLLVPLDSQRVELPREIGTLLRERASAGTSADPPEIATVSREPVELDRLGTTAVLEFLRQVDALADEWTARPPALLRSGGLGVRELRRTARALGVEEPAAALVAEVAYAAGLLNSTNGPEPVFLPTAEFDHWQRRDTAPRWIALAAAWLAMTRQPSLVNQRGERDRVITALGPDAERGTIPALRRHVLDLLTELPPGAAPADRGDVLARFAWQQPRRASGQVPLVEAILAEADLLGATAAGGLTGYTRTLLAGATGGPDAVRTSAAAELARTATAAEHALARALPDPVDHFLVQPDLTIVVPGPPEPALAGELALLADLESTGGANVYRITERSVRRALDAGRSGEQLAAFVDQRSRTPVPQALRYMIDDAARRHGVLRAGAAASYLRCDDQALLSRVLADRAADALGLRLIAPTVVVSEAPVNRVLEALREGGYSPAAESPGGALITLGVDAPRAPSRPPARSIATRGGADTDAQLAELVRRIRSGDALAELGRRVQPIAAQVPGVTSAATMELLRRAVREDLLLWLGVAEPDGSATAHELRPISLAAGFVRGYEEGRAGLVSYPVHRITAVRVLDDEDD